MENDPKVIAAVHPCDVEVYLGEGIWWRIPAHKASRYSGMRQRPVRRELERNDK